MNSQSDRTKVSGKHTDLARKAAIDASPVMSVGDFIEAFDDGENLVTYLFESKQKGYIGWRWSVTVFASGNEATVSELVLIPGPDSLVAPDWVPWSERLADYKALQAELEAQAALQSVDEEDLEDNAVEELPTLDDEPADETEGDSEETGKKPRFSRARKLFGIKKVRGKSKKPKD